MKKPRSKKEMQKAINKATNLKELGKIMGEINNELPTDECSFYLQQKYSLIWNELKIPSFGDNEPKNKVDVVSWDDTHILWYSGELMDYPEYSLQPRDEWHYNLDEEDPDKQYD